MALAAQDITVPGGVKVFFTETGGTERDLGNIVGDSVSITRDTEELEHFTNRSGKRRKDRVITVEESAQIDFELDEINPENLRYFFKGGPISDVGAGTAAVVDQVETMTGEIYQSVERPGLTAISVRQYLDYVFLDDNGVFVDNSAEADTAAGTLFDGIGTPAVDFQYCGKLEKFAEVYFDLTTAAVGLTGIDVEYWNGSTWVAVNTLVDGTTNFTVDGVISHVPQTNWALTSVNGVSAYWIRISEPTTVTTPPDFLSIGRQALVEHTDYDVDPGAAVTSGSVRDGSVRRIAAGALESGEKVKVSYTYVTFTSQTFGIAELSVLEGSARFEAFPGTGRGRKWNIIIPKCQLINNGSMDLDDTDFETIPLSLMVLDNYDVDATNPFGTVTVFPHA